MSIMRRMPGILLPLALAACFVSAKPLFSEREADYPITDGAIFSVQILNETGEADGEAPQQVTITRDGAYYLYTVKGEDEPLRGLLDDLGDGNYAAVSFDEESALYGLYQQRGEKWLRHGMSCSDFEALAAKHGKSGADFGIKSDGNECSFSSYDDLKRALLFQARHGRPDAEYSPVE